MEGEIAEPEAKSPQRSREPSIAQAASTNNILPPVKTKPPSRVPAPSELCHNPVTPRTRKDAIGSAMERSTGITYPYNMWGPCSPNRFGQPADAPLTFSQKDHYLGKHDKLMKDRLGKRKFGHTRHDCYHKSLIKPENKESLSWLDPTRKEFWRTDVERVLKQDEEKRRARQKELLGIWTNEEAWRRHNAQKMRDMKYQAYLELGENMQKVGCRNNSSGAPHINIITREPIGEHNIKLVKFKDDVAAYKQVQRTLMLRERNSGARNYSILNWTQNPPGPQLPPWPEKPASPPPPPPPDTRAPLNSSKGAISCGRVYGPFGMFNT